MYVYISTREEGKKKTRKRREDRATKKDTSWVGPRVGKEMAGNVAVAVSTLSSVVGVRRWQTTNQKKRSRSKSEMPCH